MFFVSLNDFRSESRIARVFRFLNFLFRATLPLSPFDHKNKSQFDRAALAALCRRRVHKKMGTVWHTEFPKQTIFLNIVTALLVSMNPRATTYKVECGWHEPTSQDARQESRSSRKCSRLTRRCIDTQGSVRQRHRTPFAGMRPTPHVTRRLCRLMSSEPGTATPGGSAPRALHVRNMV